MNLKNVKHGVGDGPVTETEEQETSLDIAKPFEGKWYMIILKVLVVGFAVIGGLVFFSAFSKADDVDEDAKTASPMRRLGATLHYARKGNPVAAARVMTNREMRVRQPRAV
jgi:hypothetical protein